jgi:hypothetical protein
MPFRESSGYCPACQRQVLVRKETPSNTFHLLMCVFTCGLWVFVWIGANLLNLSAKYRCTNCGTQLTSDMGQVRDASLPAGDVGSGMLGQAESSGSMSPRKVVALILAALFVGGPLLITISFLLGGTNTPPAERAANTSFSATPVTAYSKERVQRGEKLFTTIAAKYRMGVEFGWQATFISLPVPKRDWDKLSKEDKVNVTLYAESLVPAVKAAPRKYVDRWKQRVQNLELSYDEFLEAASKLCDTCWQVEVGEPVKDINGIWDVEGNAIVTGRNAAQFR